MTLLRFANFVSRICFTLCEAVVGLFSPPFLRRVTTMIGFSGCGGVGGAAFDWRKERQGKQTFAPDVTERRAMMPVGARFFGRTDTFIIGSCRIDCRILCSFPTFKSRARPSACSAQPALLQAGKGRRLKVNTGEQG